MIVSLPLAASWNCWHLPSRLHCYLDNTRSTGQETAAIEKIVCWIHGSSEQGEGGTTQQGFILGWEPVGQGAEGQRSEMGTGFLLWLP